MNRKWNVEKFPFRSRDLKLLNTFSLTNLHDAVRLVVPQGLHHVRLVFGAPEYVGSTGTSEVWVSIFVPC